MLRKTNNNITIKKNDKRITKLVQNNWEKKKKRRRQNYKIIIY